MHFLFKLLIVYTAFSEFLAFQIDWKTIQFKFKINNKINNKKCSPFEIFIETF